MEFLVDNYIWIILVIVVILMTIIGYIAEKTNFGKKEFAKRGKKAKQKLVEKENENPKENMNSEISNAVQTEDDFKNQAELENEMITENTGMDFTGPLSDDMKIDHLYSTQETDERVSEPINNELNGSYENEFLYKDESQSLNEKEQETSSLYDDFSSSSQGSINTIDNLNMSFADMDNSMEEMNMDDSFDKDSQMFNEEANLNLPDLDSIKEDVHTTVGQNIEDDDIWKF